MKIITRFSLINTLINTHRYFFSNLIKDNPLSIDDLVINNPTKNNKLTSSSSPNKSKNLKVSSQVINADDSKVKINQMINLIDKTFSKATIQPNTSPLTFKNNTPSGIQAQNSMEFMKYLDHSLQKTVALEIISMVQKYCSRKDYTDQQNSLLLDMLSNKRQLTITEKYNQYALFGNIKDHLILNLNFYSEDIEGNNQLIQCLLQMLSKSDPTQINVQSFERQSFSLDEQERIQKTTGKQYFLQTNLKYSQQNHPQQSQSIGHEKTQENKYKIALQQAFQLKDRTKFSKLRLKKNANQAEQKHKPKQVKLKMASENAIFHKRNTEESIANNKAKEDDLRSAYIYELPYNITEFEAESFIQYLQKSKNIKVQSYVLFPYKNFLQKNHYDVIFRIPELYQDKNVHIEKTLKNISIDEFTSVGDNKTKKRSSKQTKKGAFDDVPLQNQPNRKIVTEALLLKIKKENYSKFNKSSMVLKFKSKEDKQSILTKQSRLYGLCYKNLKNIKFEQGYCKTAVALSGIAWGCSSKDLQFFLNKILQPEKIPIQIEEDCILTKSMISIQFDHLSEALIAIKKLNNIAFQNKIIRAHLKYGSCKLFNNKYNLNLEDEYDKLKKKVGLLGTYFQKKYDEPQCSEQ